MMQNASFRRKVIYGCVIVALLIPLYLVGRPATGDPDDPDVSRSPGGRLAQLRTEYGISQADLGAIDPASESMKLASLGMRGVAANILWSQANKYKREEDWDNLRATLNQITRLQPNFISVWEFQAHNLSYNVSVEFDDYRHRYHWVKKGVAFLVEGTRYNRNHPRLYWNLGWFCSQKFGMADERKQFRRMFRDDTDFHDALAIYVPIRNTGGPDKKPDNWLVGRLWYLKAQNAVDTLGMPIKKSPLIFHSHAPMCRINYAMAIQREGWFDPAQFAWRDAGMEWDAYGERQIPTSWGDMIRLGQLNATREEAMRLERELNDIAPGVHDRLRQERIDRLTEDERVLIDMPLEEMDGKTFDRARVVRQKITFSPHEVAKHVGGDERVKARSLARRIDRARELASRMSNYRQQVNYDYWETRCQLEREAETAEAHRNIYEADRHREAAEPEDAKAKYEAAFAVWAKLFDKHEVLDHSSLQTDLVDTMKRYFEVLGQLDEELRSDFPLMDLAKKREVELPPIMDVDDEPQVPKSDDES